MVARKTHFDFYSNGTAPCGQIPRGNAGPLLTTIIESAVSCTGCLKFLEEQALTENEIVAFVETMDDGSMDAEMLAIAAQHTREDTQIDPKVLDLADRYDLEVDFVESAISAGWLKL